MAGRFLPSPTNETVIHNPITLTATFISGEGPSITPQQLTLRILLEEGNEACPQVSAGSVCSVIHSIALSANTAPNACPGVGLRAGHWDAEQTQSLPLRVPRRVCGEV